MAAQGTFTLFNDFAEQLGEKLNDFESGGDTFKVQIIDNTKTAVKTDVNPVIGDYTAVSGGTYADQTLANQACTLSGNVATVTADDVTFAKDAASGPTTCYQAVLFNDGATKYCVGFIELTADSGVTPLSLKDAAIVLNWGSGTDKLFTITIPANA